MIALEPNPSRSTRGGAVVATWLTLQLLVILYFLWLEGVDGVGDHHRGMFLMAIMAVLLFPGGELVMYLVAIPFRVAEYLGHPILVQNDVLASLLTLLLWGCSAFITFRFWKWVWTWFRRPGPSQTVLPSNNGSA